MVLDENLGEVASGGNIINAVVSSGNLNILHFNAQSLVPRENSIKFDEVRYLMESCLVDMFGVTETWYKDFICDSAVSISGYKLFRKDRDGSRGGGVCLYIRENLRTGAVFDCHYDDNVESIFVEVIVDENSVVLVGVVYLPNGQFLSCERVLDNFSSRYNNVIVMGDFNTNLFTNNITVREVCERLSLFVVHNSLPTHYSPQQRSTSLIDFYLVSDIDLVIRKCQFQIPALNSYHAAVFISYNVSRSHSSNTFFYRDYRHLNFEHCVSQLELMDFSGVYNCLSVDDGVECFNSILCRLFEDNVPVRRVVRSRDNHWMNDSRIQTAKHVRDRAYRVYRRSRSDENFAAFRRVRNRLKTIIRRVRKEYCLRFFSECDQRQMWRKMRSEGIINSTGNFRFPFSLNEFNEFSMLRDTVDDGIVYMAVSGGFTFSNVDENDVLNAVFRIKSEAVGADGIHIRFLRFIIPAMLRHLTFVINKVLTTSVVPRIWKVGRIVPIPKVKTPRNCSDFRPISILSVCSKILEFIVRDQMLLHLNSSNMIHSHQSGFRNGYSTTGILLDITESIRENYDRGGVSVLIFLDYCKAFDSICHKLLITKLSRIFGFGSSACKLICSFLSGRCQYVQVEQEVSNIISTSRGVPQGSILGPLLFLLYMNDLFNVTSFFKAYTYADDIQLLAMFDSSSIPDSEERINCELARLVAWSSSNFLQLNPTKCKVMIFSKRDIILNVVLENEQLEIVPYYRTLGIVLDNKLTFNRHTNFVISRISWTLRRLYSVAFYLPLSVRRRVALALCLPLLIYGIEVYSCTSVMNMNRLRVCFNKVIRYIFRLRYDEHVSEFYSDLLGCSFTRYVQVRQMIFFYKTIKHGRPDYLLSKFNFAISNRTYSLLCPIHNSLIMARSFRVNIARLWNSVIPYRERRFVHSLSTFRNIFLMNL